MFADRRVVLGLSAALALPMLSACGGGGRPAGPSRADYIAHADRVCRDTRARSAPLLRRFAAGAASLDAASARRLAPLGRHIHALAQAYLARLRALAPPEGDRDAVGHFLSLSGAVVDELGHAAVALAAGHPLDVLATLRDAQLGAKDANAAAAAYGFSDCATVLSLG